MSIEFPSKHDLRHLQGKTTIYVVLYDCELEKMCRKKAFKSNKNIVIEKERKR
jgi:hypothetical protein